MDQLSPVSANRIGNQHLKQDNAICFVSLMSKKFILTAKNESETSCLAYKNTFKFALEETINKHRLRKDIALLLLNSKVTDAKEISTFRY